MAPRNPARAAASPQSSSRSLAALSACTWMESSAATVAPFGQPCHARTIRMALGPPAGAESATHSRSTLSEHALIILLASLSSSKDKTKPPDNGNRLVHAKNGDETPNLVGTVVSPGVSAPDGCCWCVWSTPFKVVKATHRPLWLLASRGTGKHRSKRQGGNAASQAATSAPREACANARQAKLSKEPSSPMVFETAPGRTSGAALRVQTRHHSSGCRAAPHQCVEVEAMTPRAQPGVMKSSIAAAAVTGNSMSTFSAQQQSGCH